MEDDLLTPEEAAELLRMTTAQLAQLRYTGGGPIYRRLTHKTIRYRRRDLHAFIEGTAHARTDQPIPASA